LWRAKPYSGKLRSASTIEAVAGDLGDDRGRGDAGASRVAVDEIPLRTGEVAERDEVGDDQIGATVSRASASAIARRVACRMFTRSIVS